MARKQYGLKFEEEDVARWDQFAESQGWTRTTLLGTAVERLIAATEVPGTVSKDDPEPAPEEPEHRARPGVRKAYICTHKDCKPPRRVFLERGVPDVAPECPEHGRTMQKQRNKPYAGQQT